MKLKIGPKIFFSFFFVIFIFGVALILGVQNLIKLETLSNKIVPYNERLTNLQDYSDSLGVFERNLDEYLVVLNSETRTNAESELKKMEQTLILLEKENDDSTSSGIASIRKAFEGIKSDFTFVTSIDYTNTYKANDVNLKVISIYGAIVDSRATEKIIIDDTKKLVSANSQEQQSIITLMLNQFIIVGLISLVLAVVLSIVLTMVIAKPITEITKVAQQIVDGNLDVKFPEIKTQDEIKDLTSTLDMMLGALKFLRDEGKNKKK